MSNHSVKLHAGSSPDEALERALCLFTKKLYDTERDIDRAAEKSGLRKASNLLGKAADVLSTLEVAGSEEFVAPLLRQTKEIETRLNGIAANLPDPRRQVALAIMAQTYVAVFHHIGHRAVLSNDGGDVQRFKRVTEFAGIFLSTERLRGVLAEALQRLDAGTLCAPAVDIARDIECFMLWMFFPEAWLSLTQNPSEITT